ncbi:Sodium/hydrogen exchanger family-domain-containing protein [Chytridium lagenaria]|nr:Sodium/hydrogen exchanger family-domain-containing protein [Chytridium lagenaria]
MLSMVLVSMNINGFLHKKNFHYLSESAVMILLGDYDANNTDIQLSANFFYMGGFTLQRVSFFANFLTIFSLAFAGALTSTFICSILMWIFSKAVMPWSLAEALSTVVSTCLFSENSALNDAVSIILFRFFSEIADPKMKLGVGPFFISVFASAGVFVGSFLVGISIALAFALITKHVKMPNSHVMRWSCYLCLAYSSYLLADVLGLAGIISIFFCGVAMAHYAAGNLSEEARRTIKTTLRVLAFMCECFIFLYLGLGLLSFGGKTTYNPLMILFSVISILVAPLPRLYHHRHQNWLVKDRDEPIPLNQQTLIWFSGLRGAVAFALGVSFLEIPVFDEDIKGMIFGTAVVTIVITIIVFGGLTPYMLVWLKITKPDAAHGGHEHLEDGEEGKVGELRVDVGHGEEGHKDEDTYEAEEDAMEEEQKLEIERKVVFGWLYHLDAKFIRPHFTNRVVDTFTPKALFPVNPPPPDATEKEVIDSRPSSRKHSTVMSASQRRFPGLKAASKQSSAIDMESIILRSSRQTSEANLVQNAAEIGESDIDGKKE